jgi:hypothetical protein
MKARDIPPDAFPIVLESEGPDDPPVVWGGHISIVLVRRKEADGAGREHAAQGS